MAYDAAELCPRCGVPMPATARFCRSCGLTQKEAQEARLRAVQTYEPAYQAPVAAAAAWVGPPASVPANDPFGHARRSPAYRNPPAGSFDDEPPRSTFWASLWTILVVVCLVLLVLGVSGVAIFYYSSVCSLDQRDQLRGDIPLPCGITFQDHLNRSASGTTGKGSEEWIFSVDSTSPAQLKAFYMQNLPDNGWTLPSVNQAVAQQNPKLNAVLACKAPTVAVIYGTQQTTIDDNISPPPGTSLLIIILVPYQNLTSSAQQALGSDCSG